MKSFFDIASVGIVGASETEGKIGNGLLKFLNLFNGRKYGVNPKGGSYNGIKFYKSIKELPEIVDILVFVIPAKLIPISLLEAGDIGIKRVIIISAGFKEVGNLELENEIKSIAKEKNIMLLGPNCLGYIDIYKNLNLSFGTRKINKGNISIISQSGAMAVAITDWALLHNLGFSKIISLGNKAGLDELDFLLELEKDENTKLIVLYLESLERGKEFINVTKRISQKKPIIILKSGISEMGQKAASSHTGAVSSDKTILFSAFKSANLHFTNSLEEFFIWIEAFSKIDYKNIPEELAIITNAGGPGVISTDYAEKYNINLTSFSKEEKVLLKDGLFDSLTIENPIDIIGDASSLRYFQILKNFKNLKIKRAILILLTAQYITDVENIAQIIVEYKKQNLNQLIFTSFIGGEGILKGQDILNKSGILDYSDPAKAINVYSRLIIQKRLEKEKNEEIEKIIVPNNIKDLIKKIQNEKGLVSNNTLWEIFNLFNVNYIKDFLAKNEEDIKDIYNKLKGSKIAARISSTDIKHKLDIGGVVLNIETKEDCIKAFNKIIKNVNKNAPNANIEGIMYSKMAFTGIDKREIFLGFKRDKSFGNIMIIGMGGSFVNVFEDVSIRVGLISKAEIYNMLQELKYAPILNGVRGIKKINFDSLINLIFNIQIIFDTFTRIKEIDINPIISDEKESEVVDAKFYL